jgi:hypothetical protein
MGRCGAERFVLIDCEVAMRPIKFTFLQGGDLSLRYLNDSPDYATQGTGKEYRVENLKDFLTDMKSGQALYLHNAEELLVA